MEVHTAFQPDFWPSAVFSLIHSSYYYDFEFIIFIV